jgi:hypothetical protein
VKKNKKRNKKNEKQKKRNKKYKKKETKKTKKKKKNKKYKEKKRNTLQGKIERHANYKRTKNGDKSPDPLGALRRSQIFMFFESFAQSLCVATLGKINRGQLIIVQGQERMEFGVEKIEKSDKPAVQKKEKSDKPAKKEKSDKPAVHAVFKAATINVLNPQFWIMLLSFGALVLSLT